MKKCEDDDLVSLKQLIVDLKISDPVSGSKNWTDIKQFNLCFQQVLVQAQNLHLRYS